MGTLQRRDEEKRLPNLLMTSIQDYPELGELENWLVGLWETSVNDFMQSQGFDQYPFDIYLDEIIVYGRFGKGTGEVGEDPLEVAYIFSADEPVEESETDQFDVISTIVDNMEMAVKGEGVVIEGLDVIPPQEAQDWFIGVNITKVPGDRVEEFFQAAVLNRPGPSQAYSITNGEYLIWDTKTVFFHTGFQRVVTEEEAEEFPELAIEEREESALVRRDPDEVVEEEDEDEDVQIFAPPEEEEDEEDEIDLHDISIEDQINDITGTVEVPTGKKQATTVQYRELYDFEKEMLAPMDGGTDMQIEYGIGHAIATGSLGKDQPAITFPRTGFYVKNRLQHVGPAYVRELHKDMCRYSWAIIEEHKVYVRPGLYENFRNMIFKLKDAGLIRPLSQQEAAARGLQTTPTTPDGREATFLEPRNYYTIVDGEEDAPEWFDVTAALYS